MAEVMAEEIQLINLASLGRFGVGKESNTLYFDGQRVHTDGIVSLTAKQAKFATAVGVATIIAAISSFSYGVVYIFDTLCTKAPVRTELVTTPNQLPFPIILSQAGAKALAPPGPKEAAPAPEQVTAPTSQ